MSEFREWLRLSESPVAVAGDWPGFKIKTTRIKKIVIEKYWILKDSINDGKHKLYIYKFHNENTYILGAWAHEVDTNKEVFVIITQIKTAKRNDLKKLYTNPVQISKIETMGDFKGQGFGKLFYRWFLEQGYTLISDMVQFDGDRKLFDSIAKDKDVISDIINDQDAVILKHNAVIDSGKDFWDFDTKIWSYDFSKSAIRIASRLK